MYITWTLVEYSDFISKKISCSILSLSHVFILSEIPESILAENLTVLRCVDNRITAKAMRQPEDETLFSVRHFCSDPESFRAGFRYVHQKHIKSPDFLFSKM